MCSSTSPILFWGYWANIVYIIGMIGYLTIDIISYTSTKFDNALSFLIYLLLAILFVLDASLYTVDWYVYAMKFPASEGQKSIQYPSEFFACIFQNLGSYFYLFGAVLSCDKTRWINHIFLLNFLGILCFLIESILVLLGWFIIFGKKLSHYSKDRCTFRNLYVWAHAFNILGNLVYLCAILFAYNCYRNYKILNSDTALLIQILGDLVYLFDAYLYHECWKRDAEIFDIHTEQCAEKKFEGKV
ncbi:unnamed protein product [Adineta ricciae]|uniref:Uncharacterized protein n=1 Tax=Adineta ricciae TaxID=249248 RepID=A0A816EBT1_ADIRI|nr:unnamed protein product [Adineta ricciae]CAF1644025.1 unnamed protein product [Adineta ricciae]